MGIFFEAFITQVGNAACVCLQEANSVWAQLIREIAPRCAATPAIEGFSQNHLMMIWRTDVLSLQGDVEVCRVFPSEADNSNSRRNWRVYLKARVAKTKLTSITQNIFASALELLWPQRRVFLWSCFENV